MNDSCNLSFPYPEVKVERRNKKAADLLNHALFSALGELNAVSDYTFQSIITAETDPFLSDIFECISITEMKHFKILAKTVYLLGAIPTFGLSGKRYRDGNHTPNTFDVKAILKKDIENEINAIKTYRQIISQIGDGYIKRTLERIILDEEHHTDIFSSLIK